MCPSIYDVTTMTKGFEEVAGKIHDLPTHSFSINIGTGAVTRMDKTRDVA